MISGKKVWDVAQRTDKLPLVGFKLDKTAIACLIIGGNVPAKQPVFSLIGIKVDGQATAGFLKKDVHFFVFPFHSSK